MLSQGGLTNFAEFPVTSPAIVCLHSQTAACNCPHVSFDGCFLPALNFCPKKRLMEPHREGRITKKNWSNLAWLSPYWRSPFVFLCQSNASLLGSLLATVTCRGVWNTVVNGRENNKIAGPWYGYFRKLFYIFLVDIRLVESLRDQFTKIGHFTLFCQHHKLTNIIQSYFDKQLWTNRGWRHAHA